ncbi:uncharacterized protein LOC122253199 isoform X2 [Penaeus japonicus]|nr:uncharacterized protein LOC122253199 isoform X2 [Penaeus japonicus]
MNGQGLDDRYDILSVNKSLDELGMLSTVTESRKEYLQECLRDGMEKLNVDQPGPSNARWDPQKSPKSPGSSNSTEKENTNLGGFQVLTMNSTFITSFKAGYELPCHGIREPTSKRVYKCSLTRRRRLRTHPYDNNMPVPSTSETPVYNNGSYRLRTTSLSSGTSKSRGNNRSHNGSCSSTGSNGPTLVRSRSMENLSASINDGLTLSSKPRELETVSRGIQQLKMDDCV